MWKRNTGAGRLAAFAMGVTLIMTALSFAAPADAQETINWKAVTLHRNGPNYDKWLWFKEEAAKRTDGRLQVEIMTYPELGLTGADVLRVMASGLISLAEVSSGYVSADFPLIEGTDLPGLISDLDGARKAYDSWTEAVVAPNSDKVGGVPYSTFAWGPIYLMTRDAVESMSDIKGMKIRVFAPAQARYIEEFGAEPISMPISEVYSALQRGTIDGMITGLDQLKPMAAWEITPNITDIGIAPLGAYLVISQRAWDGLPDDVRAVLKDMQAEFTDVGWAGSARVVEEGFAIAKEHKMTVKVPAPEAIRAEFSTVAKEVMVPWWVERVGPEGEKLLNEVIVPIADEVDG